MHVHIVLCCGAKRVLFTNKLSECWCRIMLSFGAILYMASELEQAQNNILAYLVSFPKP